MSLQNIIDVLRQQAETNNKEGRGFNVATIQSSPLLSTHELELIIGALQQRDTMLTVLKAIYKHGNQSGVIPCPQDHSFYIEPMRKMAFDFIENME